LSVSALWQFSLFSVTEYLGQPTGSFLLVDQLSCWQSLVQGRRLFHVLRGQSRQVTRGVSVCVDHHDVSPSSDTVSCLFGRGAWDSTCLILFLRLLYARSIPELLAEAVLRRQPLCRRHPLSRVDVIFDTFRF
jgi:hypothetical protein